MFLLGKCAIKLPVYSKYYKDSINDNILCIEVLFRVTLVYEQNKNKKTRYCSLYLNEEKKTCNSIEMCSAHAKKKKRKKDSTIPCHMDTTEIEQTSSSSQGISKDMSEVIILFTCK